MVLAELDRFPLQYHFWQQILRHHHRTIALDNVRLVKPAMVDGFALDQTAVKDSLQHCLGDFLHGHLGQQQLFHNYDIASVVERAKHQHALEYFADVQHSSLVLYRTMQPEYKPAEYLTVGSGVSSVRQIEGYLVGLGLDAMVCG